MNFVKTLLFILFIGSSPLYSQVDYTISGNVQNTETGQPVQDVYVFIESLNKGTITDGRGVFEISGLDNGKHHLVASNIGFKTVKKEIEIENKDIGNITLGIVEILYDLPQVLVESISLTGGYSGIDDLHGSAHYISKKELTKFNYSDVHQILKAVPGVQIQEEDGFGLRPNIGIRGTSTERSAKITLMEDGVLIAPAPYSAPSAYYFPTIGRMEGVEILKGSSQIKHGPYTTGGALNMLSKRIPVDNEATIDASMGSFLNRKLEASYGDRLKNIGYLLQGLYYGSSGFKELDSGENTGFDKTDLLAKFNINSDNNSDIYQSLTLKFNYNKEVSNETYLGLSDDDFKLNPLKRYAGSQVDQMNANHQTYVASYTVEFSPQIQMNTTAYYNYFHRNWYKLDRITNGDGSKVSIGKILDDPESYSIGFEIAKGTSSGNDRLYVKANNRSYNSAGIQSIAHFYLNQDVNKHKLNLGFRYHYDEMDRFQWEDQYSMSNGIMNLETAGLPGTESNRIQSANAIAAFARLDLNWGKLSINPGLRLESMVLTRDDYGKEDPERTGLNLTSRENKETVLIPGISFNYEAKKSWSLFGGVHKGFSPPSTKDESSPESSINYEFGTKVDKGLFSSQIVLYYTDYSNLLGSDVSAGGGSGNDELFNGGEVDIKGMEFYMQYIINHFFGVNTHLPISLKYGFSDARFNSSFSSELDIWGEVSSGDQLPYLAKHQVSLSLSLEHRKYGINFQSNYNSPMLTRAGKMDINDQYKMDPGFHLDLGFHYDFSRKLRGYLNIFNMTNNIRRISRHPAGLRPSSPRSIVAGFNLEF